LHHSPCTLLHYFIQHLGGLALASLCLHATSSYIRTSTRTMQGLSVTLGALHFGGYGLMTVAATAAACWLASTAAAIKKHAH